MALSRFFVVFFYSLMVVFQSIAQDHENVSQVAQISFDSWNRAEAIAIKGEYAYVADADSGLRIIDISRPISPQETALFAYEGLIWDVATSSDYVGYVYMACENGMVVVNVIRPGEPREVAVFDDIGEIRGVTVSRDYAYVALGRNGIGILDISEHAEIQLLGEIDTPGFAIRIAVAGDYAYVADRDGGLRVVNVEDPTEPVEVGSVEPEGETRDVAVAGRFAYLGETEAVSKIDISEPDNPHRVNRYEPERPVMALATDGDLIYAALTADHSLEIIFAGWEMYRAGRLRYSTGPVDVALRGNHVFTVDHSIGLMVADISDSTNPFEAGRLGSGIWFGAVAFSNNHAFFGANPTGLMIYNVSDPTEPILVWRDSPDISLIARDVVINGQYLYIVDESGRDGSLRIADISDPDDPQWLGECNIYSNPCEIIFTDQLLYILSDTRYLDVYDISDPTSPEMTGRIYNPELRYYDFEVIDDLAYLTTTGDGLVVLNIADPMNVREIGRFAPLSQPHGIEILGDYAILVCNRTFEIVDISNPREMSRVSLFDLPDSGWEIHLSGNYAYIACRSSGLRVINIADYTNPVEIGFYDTPGHSWDVTVAGDLAFVADGYNFGIYDCSEALGAPEDLTLQPTTCILEPAYPNPFNSSTTIRFNLPSSSQVSLTLTDLTGRRFETLLEDRLTAGRHRLTWDAKDYPAGMYLCRMEVGGFRKTRKVVLVK